MRCYLADPLVGEMGSRREVSEKIWLGLRLRLLFCCLELEKKRMFLGRVQCKNIPWLESPRTECFTVSFSKNIHTAIIAPIVIVTSYKNHSAKHEFF
jgi:hypothetical protein